MQRRHASAEHGGNADRGPRTAIPHPTLARPMTTLQHYLRPLLVPASVAVVGATNRAGSVGRVLIENLLAGGFAGELYFVNPRRKRVFGQRCFASLRDIGKPVDLALIAVPGGHLHPRRWRACGRQGRGPPLVAANRRRRSPSLSARCHGDGAQAKNSRARTARVWCDPHRHRAQCDDWGRFCASRAPCAHRSIGRGLHGDA